MSSTVVLAYDGHIVDSLDARAFAVVEALHAEGITIDVSDVRACVAGRSIAEAVHAAAQKFAFDADATSLDLAALRADRAFSAAAARGLPMVSGAANFVQRIAARARIFLRADSRRKDVTSILAMSQLEALVAVVRCSDDGGLRTVTTADHTLRSLTAAYTLIAGRLEARGDAPGSCCVYETSEHAQDLARAHGFSVAAHALRAD